MRKKICMMAAALCAVVFMCGFSVTAYAGGGEDYGDPTMTAEPKETSEAEPNPFTPAGTGTVIDHATDEDGKEFYTIMTPAENVFYLVIDRQRETENVYFLNAVTEADLMALAEIPPVSDPAPTAPEQSPAPVEPEPTPEQTPVQGGGNIGMIIFVIAVVLVGGGAGWYFKIYRPKQQQGGIEEDIDYGADELDPYGGNDQDTEPEDDGPPWYEDDGDGSAGYGDDDE